MNPVTTVQIFVISGLVLAVVCAVFAGCFGLIYNNIVEKSLVISEDNEELYDVWTETPVPLYIQFYIFNVTNPDEIQYFGQKPILEEFGPYVYEEWLEKLNVTFDDSEGTVEYVDKTTYYFNREMSIGDETDEYTMLNMLMVILGSVGYNSEAIIKAWPILEKYSDLFEVHSVGDFIFYGYDLPVFVIDTPLGSINLTLYEILDNFLDDQEFPLFLQDNKFGLFYGANGTSGSTFKVNTGEKDMDEYLEILEYNEATELDYWNDTYCNMINGTDGTQFPPGVEREDVLYLFVGEICRSLYTTYEQDIRQHDEVNTYRFTLPASVLADPNVSPENECYCTKVYYEDEECLGAGMLNLAPCAGDVPIVISTPHFYMGDEDEIDKLVGIEPVKELHETFLDVEPVTGVVLSAAKRIQLNLPLRHYGDLSTFESVPECVLPIFWIDEGAAIGKEDAEDFQNILTIPFIIVYTLCAVLIAAGIVLVVIGVKRRRDMTRDEKGYHKESLSSHDEKD